MGKPRKQTAQATQDKQDAAKKEDPRVTFVRLGEPRLAAALKRIAILKNVARYPHSAKQADKVLALIDAAVDDLRQSFGPKSAVPSQVSLSDE